MYYNRSTVLQNSRYTIYTELEVSYALRVVDGGSPHCLTMFLICISMYIFIILIFLHIASDVPNLYY